MGKNNATVFVLLVMKEISRELQLKTQLKCHGLINSQCVYLIAQNNFNLFLLD